MPLRRMRRRAMRFFMQRHSREYSAPSSPTRVTIPLFLQYGQSTPPRS